MGLVRWISAAAPPEADGLSPAAQSRFSRFLEILDLTRFSATVAELHYWEGVP